MNKNNTKQVAKYYQSFESRLGYKLFLKGSQHFGLYPDGVGNIPEQKAQENLHLLLAEKLGIDNANNHNQKILLDAGSGQGFVSCDLARRFNVCIEGITVTPHEVKDAEIRARNYGVSHKTNYQIMDYHNLNFPDNYFDCIYTTETLCHAYDLEKVIKEFYRVLKPGGKVAFFEYKIAEESKLNESEKTSVDIIAKGTSSPSLKLFRESNFLSILQGMGFINTKEEDLTRQFKPSLERLYKISIIPYQFIKLFHLKRFFINTVIGYEFYHMTKKGLIQYLVHTGEKK